MDYKVAALLDNLQIFEKLETSENGLTSEKAKDLLQKYGENKIRAKETTTLDIFLRQFKSPFTYLLLAASILSFALGEKLDGAMIGLFVVLNAILSFIQEYRSEQT